MNVAYYLILALPVVTLCYPDQWPHQTLPLTSYNLDNTSYTVAVRLSSGTCPSWQLWGMVHKVRWSSGGAPLAGLAFLWSKETNISNVVLRMSCGATQNSTSKYANEYSLAFPQIQVALSFVSCHGIKLTNVRVVIYNPVGVVNIDKCQISHNGLSGEQEDIYGEGG